MRPAVVRAIAARDLRVLGRSRGVLVPLVVVPLLVLVLLPAIFARLPSLPGASEQLVEQLPVQLITPPAVQAQLAALGPEETFVVLALLHFMAPIYLLVPLIVSSVIAADSFAGERERKSLESLLYLPATDAELLVAKLVGAWLPAVGVGAIGWVLYGLTIDLAGWEVMGRIFFPTWTWVVIGLWLMPAVAALGLTVGVLVSSRMATVQEASQLGAIVVLPLLMGLIGQISGRIELNVLNALGLGGILWVTSGLLLFFVGRRWCTREALLTR